MRIFPSLKVWAASGSWLSLRLPSGRIEAAAGFPVGRVRSDGSGLTVAPSGRGRASRGLPLAVAVSPMEREASTLGA